MQKPILVMVAVGAVLLVGAAAFLFVTSTQSSAWNEDTLYAFVREEIKDISQSFFKEQWDIHYHDVTGDGGLEALLVENYTIDWHPNVEIVSKANRRYERIRSEIYAGKYGTYIEWSDGLLAVTARTGGPGEQLGYLSLFAFDAGVMVPVLENLLMYQRVAFPTHDFEVNGEITGPFSEFVYRQVKEDYVTDETTTELVQYYRYDSDGRRFEIRSDAGESVGAL